MKTPKHHAESERSALDLAGLCNRWGVHENTLRTMIRDGQLKTFRIRRKHMITLAEIHRIEDVQAGSKVVA